MPNQNQTYRLSPYYDLEPLITENSIDHILNFTIGPNNEIHLFAVDNVPKYLNGTFPPTVTTTTHNYDGYIISEKTHKKYTFASQNWSYHYFQPIHHDKFLLACARSRYYDKNNIEQNAKIFNSKGELLREFCLGDGIKDLKVTESGTVWTSYFDEGIIGNFGWTKPIGSPGLRSWDLSGKPMFRHKQTHEHLISDCYALNVKNDNDVWFYYYMDFELARITDGKDVIYYKTDVHGAKGFVVFDKFILFKGEYGNQDEYLLYEIIPNQRLKYKRCFIIKDENSDPIESAFIDCRGHEMIVYHNDKLYKLSLIDLLKSYM